MSESASDISFCNCNAMARLISSPSGVCLTLPFPLPYQFCFPFPCSVAFSFLFPFRIPLPFPSDHSFPFSVLFSTPWVSSSPSLLSLLLPSQGRLLQSLGALWFVQFPSSSSLLIMSSQFWGLTARKLPGLYCRQLCCSISALWSSQLYLK